VAINPEIIYVRKEQMSNLDQDSVRQIATRVATANLSIQNFTSVISSTAVDSQGQEALRIVIVIPPGAQSRIQGSTALNTLVEIQDSLRRAGEERFPIIEYATEKELAEGGDS
jgi:hypothetical protein